MKVLSRYIILEFLKVLTFCLIIFLALYITIDFLQKIDNLIDAQVSKTVIISYFLYKMPFVLIQMLPPASLISVIIILSVMKKRSEIVAIKAGGLNIFSLARPLIVGSLFMAGIVFLISEVIVPFTSSQSNRIWNIEVEKQKPNLFYGNYNIWYRGDNSIYWIQRFDYETRSMKKSTFFFFDDTFNLVKKIDARSGFWIDGQWRIEQGIIQEKKGDKEYSVRKFDFLYLDIPETPDTFVKVLKDPEEMSYWQLKKYAEKVQQDGYDHTKYIVDMNLKLAFPFIILIMVLIGVPISIRIEKGDIPLAVAFGIGLCFIYMATLGLARSLGYSNVFPPVLAAWIANIIFILLGLYFMIQFER